MSLVWAPAKAEPGARREVQVGYSRSDSGKQGVKEREAATGKEEKPGWRSVTDAVAIGRELSSPGAAFRPRSHCAQWSVEKKEAGARLHPLLPLPGVGLQIAELHFPT